MVWSPPSQPADPEDPGEGGVLRYLSWLPERLTPSRWWAVAPLLGYLLHRLRPQRLAILECQSPGRTPATDPSPIRQLLAGFSPQCRMVSWWGASPPDPAEWPVDLLLLPPGPCSVAADLLPEQEFLHRGGVVLAACGEPPEWLARRLPGPWCPSPCLPGLLFRQAHPPSWGEDLCRHLEALRSHGAHLERLADSVSTPFTSSAALGRSLLMEEARRLQTLADSRAREKEELLERTARLEERIREIESSSSWEITAPLRALAERARRLRHGGDAGSQAPEAPSAPVAEPQPEGGEAPPAPRRHGGLSRRNGGRPPDSSLPTVLIVSHEASWTGAPMLAWNLCRGLRATRNVVLLSLRGGDLESVFAEDCCVLLLGSGSAELAAGDVSDALASLPHVLRPSWALVNSLQSWRLPEWLHRLGIPAVLLIHESAAYESPQAFHHACLWSSLVVFSTPLTHGDMTSLHPHLSEVPVRILPQGRCRVPEEPGAAPRGHLRDPLLEIPCLQQGWSPSRLARCRLILGAGTVETRKGVDLFVEAANQLHQHLPDEELLFLWLRPPSASPNLAWDMLWLQDQIRRSGLGERLHIVEAPQLYEPLMQRAALFLLTSRLDPLPNVSLDALHLGVPVLGFERASGTAAWMESDAFLREHCLAAYLDPGHLARQAERLLLDVSLHGRVSRHGQDRAEESFSMDHYIRTLAAWAEGICREREQEDRDHRVIAESGMLDVAMAVGQPTQPASLQVDPVSLYLRSWRQRVDPRKPFAGFHPGIYAEHRATAGEDPLAHWLRSGRPPGPWQVPVIGPPPPDQPAPPPMRVGLHLHVACAEHAEPMLSRLLSHHLSPRLILSVPSEEVRHALMSVLTGQGCDNAGVRVVPARCGHLAPLLVEIGMELDRDCEVYGHLHGAPEEGPWDPLLGCQEAPMLQSILSAFAASPSLGLVFAEHPQCLGWGGCRGEAIEIWKRLMLESSHGPAHLPEAMNFPIGAMFWARKGALTPLFQGQWSYTEMESDAADHAAGISGAVERLLPEICRLQGFSYQLAHLQGSGNRTAS